MSKRLGEEEDSLSDRPKKRRSRWQDTEEDKSVLNGLPTAIPSGLTKEQEEQYLKQLQIEEITRRIRTGELGIPSRIEDRSPSPEPTYGPDGKRTNTRESRVRKKLEEERHKLILEVQKTNPDYRPPYDYKPTLIKLSDKLMIPQDEYPKLNFVGLIIGPRGNTLKNLEKETGAVIIIRGKGSVKEGKLGVRNGVPLPGQDEPLHAYVTASTPDSLKLAIDKIKEIIKEGIANPDGDSELRRQQLRELALLNGTLREGDPLQKLKQIQESQTIITNTIFCTSCGGAGHISQDCKQKRPSESLKALLTQTATVPEIPPGSLETTVTAHPTPLLPSPSPNPPPSSSSLLPSSTLNPITLFDKKKMDNEYLSLMAELGESVAPTTTTMTTTVLPPAPRPRVPAPVIRPPPPPPPPPPAARGCPPPPPWSSPRLPLYPHMRPMPPWSKPHLQNHHGPTPPWQMPHNGPIPWQPSMPRPPWLTNQPNFNIVPPPPPPPPN